MFTNYPLQSRNIILIAETKILALTYLISLVLWTRNSDNLTNKQFQKAINCICHWFSLSLQSAPKFWLFKGHFFTPGQVFHNFLLIEILRSVTIGSKNFANFSESELVYLHSVFVNICESKFWKYFFTRVLQIFLNQDSFVFTQYSARSSISATRHLQIIQKVTWMDISLPLMHQYSVMIYLIL